MCAGRVHSAPQRRLFQDTHGLASSVLAIAARPAAKPPPSGCLHIPSNSGISKTHPPYSLLAYPHHSPTHSFCARLVPSSPSPPPCFPAPSSIIPGRCPARAPVAARMDAYPLCSPRALPDSPLWRFTLPRGGARASARQSRGTNHPSATTFAQQSAGGGRRCWLFVAPHSTR